VLQTTDSKVKKAKKCVFPKSQKRAPIWICNDYADGMEVAAVGSAARSKAGKSFMEQMAVADARTRLARKLSEAVQSKVEDGTSPANTPESDDVEKTKIVRVSLEDTEILKRSYGPNGRLYVLIGLDKAGVQKLRDASRVKAEGDK